MRILCNILAFLLLTVPCFGSIHTPGQSLNAEVTEIGTVKSVLLVTDAQSLTANLDIPKNVQVIVLQGGSITTGAYTLTINSFEAGLYQVFFGNVTFGTGAVKEVYPQWWGALADGVNDDSLAINSAGLSLDSGTVRLPAGVYLCKHTVTFNAFLNYVGDRSAVANNLTPVHADNNGTIFYQSPELYTLDNASGGVLAYIGSGDLMIENITFVGTSALNTNPSVGLQFGVSGSSRTHEGADNNVCGINIRNVTFTSFHTAWEVNNINDSYAQNSRFESNITAIHLLGRPTGAYIGTLELREAVIYASSYGIIIGDNANMDFHMIGGLFEGSPTTPEYHISKIGGSLPATVNGLSPSYRFTGTKFRHSNSTANLHVYLNTVWDNFQGYFTFFGCTFDGGAGISGIHLLPFESSVNPHSVYLNQPIMTGIPNYARVWSMQGYAFSQLGTPANGSMVYCTDGTMAIPVTDGGTGCIAKRLNGVWVGF